MERETEKESRASVATDGPIFFYDGDCGVCTRSVRFILDRDGRGTVRFASLQGDVAEELISRRPELAGLDTMIWVEPETAGSPERIRLRSGAVIAAGKYLGGLWGVMARLGSIVPRPLRDSAYDLFARIRRKIPGMTEACSLPTPEESARFLDR